MRVVTQPLPRYGVAVAVTAVAFLFSLLLSSLDLRMPLILFIGAVVVSALQGGMRSGMMATSLGALALALNYWLDASASTPDSPREAMTLVLVFVAVGLLSSYVGEQCWRALAAVEWVTATLSGMGDGLIFTDHEGQVTFVNPAAQELTGWKQDEAEGKPLHEVYCPLDQEARTPTKTGLMRILQDRASVGSERALLVSNFGNDVHVDVRASALHGPEGKLAGAAFLIRDVSGAWHTEHQLRRSEARWRSLIANAHAAVLELDASGRCTFSNRACQHLGGFTFEESLGEGWLRTVHPDDRAKVLSARSTALQADTETTCEFRFQVPDQTVRCVRLRFTPMVAEAGERLGQVAVLENITEQKHAEEQARHNWVLLTAVAEESPHALLAKNPDGQYLLANSAGARLLGKKAQEVVGKHDSQLLPADVAHRTQLQDREALAAGQAQTHEHSDKTKAGVHHYISRRTPFNDGRGQLAGLIVTTRDVTEERCAQELLQETEQRLALEVEARAKVEEELLQAQADYESTQGQIAKLTEEISNLKGEAEARQHAEDRLRETEAQAQTNQQRCTELTDANTALQEALQQDTKIIEERMAELQQAQAALEEERQARTQAETSLQENHTRVQFLEEKVGELERAHASLQEELRASNEAGPVVPHEEDFGEALFPSGAENIKLMGEPDSTLGAPPSPEPTGSVESPTSDILDQGAEAGDGALPGHGQNASGMLADDELLPKIAGEWISFN